MPHTVCCPSYWSFYFDGCCMYQLLQASWQTSMAENDVSLHSSISLSCDGLGTGLQSTSTPHLKKSSHPVTGLAVNVLADSCPLLSPAWAKRKVMSLYVLFELMARTWCCYLEVCQLSVKITGPYTSNIWEHNHLLIHPGLIRPIDLPSSLIHMACNFDNFRSMFLWILLTFWFHVRLRFSNWWICHLECDVT
jgi:hypothetical protein